MEITKLSAAERQLTAAIQMLFAGGDTVPIYALAAAAREVTTGLCISRNMSSFFDIVAEEHPTLPRQEMYRLAHAHANFFKHADRDPEATLVDFHDDEADAVLFVATFDFAKLTGGNSLEALVFQAWHLAIHLAPEAVPENLDFLFPKVRSMPRADQLRLGHTVLGWAHATGAFRMMYDTAARPNGSQ